MARDYTIGAPIDRDVPPQRACRTAFLAGLTLPFVAAILIIAIQEMSNACQAELEARCVFGLVDADWLDQQIAGPLRLAHRGVTLLHYFAYGAVLAVLSHHAFRSLLTRLLSTGIAALIITVPAFILEVYSAWILAVKTCAQNDTATANCAMAGEVVFTQYAPFALASWALVFILPVAGAVTIGHAIIALGIEIFGRRAQTADHS